MVEITDLVSAAVSDRGLSDKRPQNEDSYIELPSYGLFAVADGVGGAQAGDVASQMAVEILAEAFTNQHPGDDAEDIMRLAIERANSAIFQMASDLPQLSSMATTIGALHINGDTATIGHVGDSRLYRIDPSGSLVRETQDHSVVEEEVRAGRMTPEQAINHPSRNVISRALGAENTVEIDLKTIMVDPGTTFLLCTDGITRHIDDFELNSFLGSDAEPAEICEQLKSLCYSRGAEDNLTGIVVRIPARQGQTFAAGAGAGESSFEGEDVTLATPRSPFESRVVEDKSASKDVVAEEEGLDTGRQEGRAADEESSIMNGISQEDSLENAPYSSARVVVPASLSTAAQPSNSPFVAEAYSEEKSTIARFLLPLVFLLVGGMIGAFGYYLLDRPEPAPVIEPTPITEMKSSNMPLTAFEEGRRLVDADPQRYVNAEAASAQVPEDYFLLGRAFLLTGKYWEAKRAFNEARNRLAEADPANAKTLAAEIAMALAIIDSPQASETFAKESAPQGSMGAASNVNSVQPGR